MTREGQPVFKTGAFNRSATPPAVMAGNSSRMGDFRQNAPRDGLASSLRMTLPFCPIDTIPRSNEMVTGFADYVFLGGPYASI